ncbi:MAG: FAD-binding protein [Thermomicrobiales bacterium]
MAHELVVVGTGLAGLAATLAAVERGAAVTLLTAGPVLSGSSPWAQGAWRRRLGRTIARRCTRRIRWRLAWG